MDIIIVPSLQGLSLTIERRRMLSLQPLKAWTLPDSIGERGQLAVGRGERDAQLQQMRTTQNERLAPSPGEEERGIV